MFQIENPLVDIFLWTMTISWLHIFGDWTFPWRASFSYFWPLSIATTRFFALVVLRATVCTHGKVTQSSSKNQVAWLHLRPCLVPSWCGASRTIWDCCWSRGISGRPGAAAPWLYPKEKRARVNGYVGLHRTFLFMILSLVSLPKMNVVFK